LQIADGTSSLNIKANGARGQTNRGGASGYDKLSAYFLLKLRRPPERNNLCREQKKHERSFGKTRHQ
jgi:hypothetical protein